MKSFSKKEIALMQKLNTPAKVQDFLNSLRFNFEKDGETLSSPIVVLRRRSAHCLEGALFGAYILSLHGFKPFILHLQTTRNDYDHVIALFKQQGLWGALSKTNHAVLRYREPIYRSIRELVMSYFHEYFLDNGVKTLRRYSRPLNLNIFEAGWPTAKEDLWGIDEELDRIRHYNFLPQNFAPKLRLADKVEIQAGKLIEYDKNDIIIEGSPR